MGLVRALTLTLTVENVEGFMQEFRQSCPFGGTESLIVAQIVLELTMSLDPPSSASVALCYVWLHYLNLSACKVSILAIELLPSPIQISSLSLKQVFCLKHFEQLM